MFMAAMPVMCRRRVVGTVMGIIIACLPRARDLAPARTGRWHGRHAKHSDALRGVCIRHWFATGLRRKGGRTSPTLRICTVTRTRARRWSMRRLNSSGTSLRPRACACWRPGWHRNGWQKRLAVPGRASPCRFPAPRSPRSVPAAPQAVSCPANRRGECGWSSPGGGLQGCPAARRPPPTSGGAAVVRERPADSTSLTAAVRRRSQVSHRGGGVLPGPASTGAEAAGNGRPWVLAGYLRTARHRGVAGLRARRLRSAPRWSPSIAGRSSRMRRPSMRFECGRLLERKRRAVAEATAILDWRLAPVCQRARAELGSGMPRPRPLSTR